MLPIFHTVIRMFRAVETAESMPEFTPADAAAILTGSFGSHPAVAHAAAAIAADWLARDAAGRDAIDHNLTAITGEYGRRIVAPAYRHKRDGAIRAWRDAVATVTG